MKWQSQQFNDDYDGDDDDELMMCIDGQGDVLFSVVIVVVAEFDLKLNWTEWLTEKSV